MVTVKELRDAHAKAMEMGEDADVVVACGPLRLFVSFDDDGAIRFDTSLHVVTLENGREAWEYSSAPESDGLHSVGIMTADGDVVPFGTASHVDILDHAAVTAAVRAEVAAELEDEIEAVHEALETLTAKVATLTEMMPKP